VVATDIRGSREEVVDGKTGSLVPLGDVPALARALQRLAADATLRKAYGKAGRDRAVALFDERRIVERQLALLKL
jgi:glycosyltransferase involved in cell wall biosynthesis